jgi:hypothetical protein
MGGRMNIYEKINAARVRLQEMAIKKSGKNSFVGFEYFELADFLPEINQLAKELKFFCKVDFTETATLEIVDTEKIDDYVIFHSPLATANLKGAHDVQNLGAEQTYLRRYLYIRAFEIVEADALDKSMDGKEVKKPEPKRLTPEELEAQKKCAELGAKLTLTKAEKKQLFVEHGNFVKLAAHLELLAKAKDANEPEPKPKNSDLGIF